MDGRKRNTSFRDFHEAPTLLSSTCLTAVPAGHSALQLVPCGKKQLRRHFGAQGGHNTQGKHDPNKSGAPLQN